MNVHGGTGLESLHGKVSVDYNFREHCIAFPITKSYHKDTASEDTFETLSNWINDCSKEHSCVESSQSILPQRVLDVGINDTTPKKFRRLRVHESSGQSGSYAALSHCWGSSPIVTSLKSNFHIRKNHISWNELSKTFQDAVTITRKLGIPYLWIDSLCIIQDDPGDWEIQSSKMLSIYSRACLTIAADHAENGDGGCFASSFKKPLLVRQIGFPETLQRHGTASIEWDKECGLHPVHANFVRPGRFAYPLSSLSSRGWTLQERLLSRRIVHYTSWELVWECRRVVDCQCGRIASEETKTLMHDFHENLHQKAKTPELIKLWMRVVEEYSKRRLTYERDKLVAIDGLVRLFEINGLKHGFAGNWMANIREMVLWSRAGRQEVSRSTECSVPTWSWASYPDSLFFDLLWRLNDPRLKRRYPTRIFSLSVERGVSGQMLDKRLTVIGTAVTLKPAAVQDLEGRSALNEYRHFLACKRSATLCLALPDYQQEFEKIIQEGQTVTGLLWHVVLDRTRSKEDDIFHVSQYSSHILILQHDPQNINQYRRLGLAFINWSFHVDNAIPPPKIDGMKQEWGLGKDWFKNATLQKLTII
ncbi:hypothetical protein HYFRA_00003604, partial [Hymenoscyphus fraxineus]